MGRDATTQLKGTELYPHVSSWLDFLISKSLQWGKLPWTAWQVLCVSLRINFTYFGREEEQIGVVWAIIQIFHLPLKMRHRLLWGAWGYSSHLPPISTSLFPRWVMQHENLGEDGTDQKNNSVDKSLLKLTYRESTAEWERGFWEDATDQKTIVWTNHF